MGRENDSLARYSKPAYETTKGTSFQTRVPRHVQILSNSYGHNICCQYPNNTIKSEKSVCFPRVCERKKRKWIKNALKTRSRNLKDDFRSFCSDYTALRDIEFKSEICDKRKIGRLTNDLKKQKTRLRVFLILGYQW